MADAGLLDGLPLDGDRHHHGAADDAGDEEHAHREAEKPEEEVVVGVEGADGDQE